MYWNGPSKALFLKLDFMQLTIAMKGNRITIALFEKNSNYTYTAKHMSDHPPVFINGIIYGQIKYIPTLCYKK